MSTLGSKKLREIRSIKSRFIVLESIGKIRRVASTDLWANKSLVEIEFGGDRDVERQFVSLYDMLDALCASGETDGQTFDVITSLLSNG